MTLSDQLVFSDQSKGYAMSDNQQLWTHLVDRAAQLDAKDPLSDFKTQFYTADPGEIYLDGNSLGRLPLESQRMLDAIVQNEWGEGLIRSWGERWYDAPTRIGDKLAGLIGAHPGEVILADSTTINLFKLVVSALAMRSDRKVIISDVLNFPTDLYTIRGAIQLLNRGHALILLESDDSIQISLSDYQQALSEQTALVTFSTPTFKSGYLHEIGHMTDLAHQAGALVLWDFSHAVGVLPLDVSNWDVDFAVGCTYKYLNGGPGSPAFIYVNHKHLESIGHQPLGWWGHRTPFTFDLDYQPAESVRRLLSGTPPILSLLPVEAGVDLAAKAGIERIRDKSLELSCLFIEAFDTRLADLGYQLGSPRDENRRGGHVSIRHAESYRIYQALTRALKLIPDFREPDNIRLGFAPLYTSFADVLEAVSRLARVVEDRMYEKYDHERARVT
jgi:kynureninase